ncbi:hypothetical protein [Yinghuangia seranimata]|uniref:hypothetical protein n=1 Tax=Yinghuangia seranimata TaxID=408067 RepID=UPI00248AF53C|nr:hypothetical protein [Yinghuangia seranimata]MDI2130547.1 hypothetical protein [Yinghuangia seranimata]
MITTVSGLGRDQCPVAAGVPFAKPVDKRTVGVRRWRVRAVRRPAADVALNALPMPG